MKAVYIIILVAGVVLTLGTESLNAATNIVGLAMCAYSCDKLNLLNI